MFRAVQFYIAFVCFSVFFMACHSNTETVNAGPRFHDEPGKLITPTRLVYADTTTPENKRIIKSLDSFYRIQVRAGFNGSVLIGQQGKILYERYFGHANRETGIKLQPETSIQLASISKTFTATAVLFLHQHNYLSIDDPVRTYLPEFPYPDVTVRMLLNHRSGVLDYQKWPSGYIRSQTAPLSNEEMLNIMARHKPRLEFKPDTRFKYSNSNYALLANIIERVTEMKYGDFMRSYIFEPLGMGNTFVYYPKEGLPSNASYNYRHNWARWPNNYADGVMGDKGIFSTPRDMYRWDQSFYQNKLLKPEIVELAYMPCSFEKPGMRNYGLGWRMLCYPSGNQVIYHNGWWHGNNTVFYRFIKENMTIIVLGNKYHNNIYKQAKVLYALTKGVPVDEGFDSEE